MAMPTSFRTRGPRFRPAPSARMLRRLLPLATLAMLVPSALLAPAASGQGVIPREYRGVESAIARGILDGNLIETNFRNHGELSRFGDAPQGVWPRGIGARHVDGIGLMVGGRVLGERVKWRLGARDTLLNPVILNYRDAGRRAPEGRIWGWLPLPGFNNPLRLDPITGLRTPTPALSDDRTSWPAFWPDRLDNPDDSGWRNDGVDKDGNVAAWNGIFGKGITNADLESYYVIDDFGDLEYSINAQRRPRSRDGVFYPSPSDSTKGGLGLQVGVRTLQWANVLSEDAMFILYTITNVGETQHDSLYFAQIADYHLGDEENDERAAFDPQQDVVYGWDADGLGTRSGGGQYRVGYTGFAFLESPARAGDALDNDEDGIRDESRFSGPGQLVTGAAAIRAYVLGNYDVAAFTRYNDTSGGTSAFEAVLAARPAFRAGKWWTGDENLDWVGFEDANANNTYDAGEPLNNDYGLDGLGPNDLGYPGKDTGEGDGRPTVGEPNFDRTDVDESDQIGLTGYDLNSRPFYESGTNLMADTWMWGRIKLAQFPLGTKPANQVADIEPFLLFTSGTVALAPVRTAPERGTDFFSTAWLFGDNEQDFFKNRRTVQSIYNADYQFAQPPIPPTLTAVAGDRQVVLTWDTLSVRSFDRFSQSFDFEGYKLYKGTNPLLSDARTITDVNGTPTFYRPLRQWDLKNGIRGNVDALGGDVKFNLGSDNGLQFYFVDTDVKNGFTYYYALAAYDRGYANAANPTQPAIDPQENVFNVSTDLGGNVRGVSRNAAVVLPRARAAGYVSANVKEDVSRVTRGVGTGGLAVRVFDGQRADYDAVYQVTFTDAPTGGSRDLYTTTGYRVTNVSTGEVRASGPFTESTPAIDGFFLTFQNDAAVRLDPALSGYVVKDDPDSTNLDPRGLRGYNTNWVANVQEATTALAAEATLSPYDFELVWSDTVYVPPRYGLGRFLRDTLNVTVRNVQKNTAGVLFIDDLNRDGQYGPTDRLIVAERGATATEYLFRHFITFNVAGPSNAPDRGDRLRVGVRRPFKAGDVFQFSLEAPRTDADSARAELKRIRVVPNPYVSASDFEPASPQITGRGERRIQFQGLPQSCTIRIFTIRGELLTTLNYEATDGGGATFWNLRNAQNQDVAPGVYVYHVKADGIGEHIGKFAIVK